MSEIVFAEEINDVVYVYDVNKNQVLKIPGKLHNYSEKYVAINRLNNLKIIDIYRADGKLVYSSSELVDSPELIELIIKANK